MVGRQNADITDVPKGRCHGNHFWLSVYGMHIGATWRIRLNRLRGSGAALALMSNYFDHLFLFTSLTVRVLDRREHADGRIRTSVPKFFDVFAESTELIKPSLYTCLQLFSVQSDGDPAA